jgi:hypothetical protein
MKANEAIRLNEHPLDGFREVVWSVNDEFNHHTVTIKSGDNNQLTIFNEEIEQLYLFLGEVLFYKG